MAVVKSGAVPRAFGRRVLRQEPAPPAPAARRGGRDFCAPRNFASARLPRDFSGRARLPLRCAGNLGARRQNLKRDAEPQPGPHVLKTEVANEESVDGPWTDPMVGRNSSTRHPRSLLPRLSPLRGERRLLRATGGQAFAPARARRCGEHDRAFYPSPRENSKAKTVTSGNASQSLEATTSVNIAKHDLTAKQEV